MQKTCIKCRIEKKSTEFHKHKRNKDGRQNYCKLCKRNYYCQNKERIETYKAIWNEANKEKVLAYKTVWRRKNPEKHKTNCAVWQKTNRDKVNANTAKRRAQKLQATPIWMTEADFKEMEALYALSDRLTKETGIPHHVDHIIPLQGELVCGLHCPLNLQVIPASENLSKNNSFDPLTTHYLATS